MSNHITVHHANKQADQKHCHSCSKILHISATHCPDCGANQLAASTNAAMMQGQPISNAVYCRGCGTGIHPEATACPKCGAPQKSAAAKPKRLTAALWAFFLGGFGAHRFYLGQRVWGVIYLLLCWTFVPAILALIETIGFLLMTDEAFEKRYG